MNRPIGVIVSAVVLGLAALSLLLMASLMVFVSIFANHQLSTAAMPHAAVYLFLGVSLFYAVLAVWATLTVIGILRLRSWARYSILIVGGGLACLGVFAALGTLLSRSILAKLPTSQPAADPHIMAIIFMVLAAIYLIIAAIGTWWLVYFNLRSTREPFSNSSIDAASSSGFDRVPTAIKILGCFLLFSSLSCLLCALLPYPAFLLGFILPHAASHILYVGSAILVAFAGYGLLRLKEPAPAHHGIPHPRLLQRLSCRPAVVSSPVPQLHGTNRHSSFHDDRAASGHLSFQRNNDSFPLRHRPHLQRIHPLATSPPPRRLPRADDSHTIRVKAPDCFTVFARSSPCGG